MKSNEIQKLKIEIAGLKKKILDIKKESLTDHLTGMKNRRAHDLELDKLKRHIKKIEEIEPVKNHFWYIMIDLDNFKYINDTFGHSLGDDILKSVSSILIHNTSSADLSFRIKHRDKRCHHNDSSYRFGGDEFIVIMVNNTKDEVKEFTKKLISDISAISHGDVVVGSSIGVAGYTENIGKTIDLADKAMYLSKKSKNKVTFSK